MSVTYPHKFCTYQKFWYFIALQSSSNYPNPNCKKKAKQVQIWLVLGGETTKKSEGSRLGRKVKNNLEVGTATSFLSSCHANYIDGFMK